MVVPFTKITAYKKGFSLVELLMVLAIMAVLAIIIIALINPVGRINYAKTKSANAQMKSIANEVIMSRVVNQKTMGGITGSFCTMCSCYDRDLRSDPCINQTNTNWAKISLKPMPKDPWGNNYTFDENEGEGGGCGYDSIKSAGPDHIFRNGDDISFDVSPHYSCPN